MSELPASVRIALWVTDAWARGTDARGALDHALPDIDAVGGDLDRLDLWRDLGEHALLVALPSPGASATLVGFPRDASAAAVEAGECLVAPVLGGILIPHLCDFGPARGPGADRPAGALFGAADWGTRLDLTAYDGDPVPRHRVESHSAGEAKRSLLAAVAVATRELEESGGRPFDAISAWEAEASSAREWALPDSVGAHARTVLVLAGAVGTAATLGLTHSADALTSLSHDRRTRALRRLVQASDAALAEATNAAVAAMAGWIPAH